jgi:GNAT superfamily N-acetyltransferase
VAVVAYGAGFAHGDFFELDGFVHPDHQGRGLGAWLLARGEEHARELGKAKLQTFSLAGDQRAHRLFEQFGMHELRRYYRMMIELEEPPAPGALPEGLTLETFEPKDARAFHDALVEAFEEEWNFIAQPFEEWKERRLVEDPDFDPTLWFLVRDGDEIAATCRNEGNRNGGGYVAALGVRRPWRGKGYAKALLLHTFREFWDRGSPRVTLGVDAESPTGATHLYERVGMHVESENVVYEKLLTQ